ncbi:MAG TPA: hypothetical protein VFK06_03170 [Candidatus Angelobacter sp.]|nr:hypothetical protein [Candidatus Angelobacter sp.]
MRNKIHLYCALLLTFTVFSNASFGQANKPVVTRQPIAVDSSYFATLKASPKHFASNRMSAAGNAAARQQPFRIVSIPTFNSSFTFGGQTFPFTMAGHAPQAGGTTMIPTTMVTMSFFFDEFVDQNGNNITIDAAAISDEIKNSPLFEKSPFSTGNTQFNDAIQRAEFFNIINRDGDNNGDNSWHTLLTTPKTLIPVTVEVPVGAAVLFQATDGNILALIDINFISSQLNTLLQTEGVTVDTTPIFLTRNAVYGDFVGGNPVDCCIGGFHSAFETKQSGNKIFVQTFAFATSLDSDLSSMIFGDPALFADVNALSHEVSELINDPFANNITPNYQLPGAPPGACQNVLETGDVVENLPNDSVAITVDGFTYHPQTEGLLQWFEGQSPSTAIGGAYSYPDTTKLVAPFTPCPQ